MESLLASGWPVILQNKSIDSVSSGSSPRTRVTSPTEPSPLVPPQFTSKNKLQISIIVTRDFINVLLFSPKFTI